MMRLTIKEEYDIDAQRKSDVLFGADEDQICERDDDDGGVEDDDYGDDRDDGYDEDDGGDDACGGDDAADVDDAAADYDGDGGDRDDDDDDDGADDGGGHDDDDHDPNENADNEGTDHDDDGDHILRPRHHDDGDDNRDDDDVLMVLVMMYIKKEGLGNKVGAETGCHISASAKAHSQPNAVAPHHTVELWAGWPSSVNNLSISSSRKATGDADRYDYDN